jgi:hypothetical protein
MGPRAVLKAVVKRKIPSPLRESKPRTPSAAIRNFDLAMKMEWVSESGMPVAVSG